MTQSTNRRQPRLGIKPVVAVLGEALGPVVHVQEHQVKGGCGCGHHLGHVRDLHVDPGIGHRVAVDGGEVAVIPLHHLGADLASSAGKLRSAHAAQSARAGTAADGPSTQEITSAGMHRARAVVGFMVNAGKTDSAL